MSRPRIYTLLGLFPLIATAKAKPGEIRYSPGSTSEDDRPVAVLVQLEAKGSDFAFRVRFNHPPWGEQCKSRCANATFFLDTDDNPDTGLKLGPGQKETGADLAVTIQGTREFREASAEHILRAVVRQLPDGSTSIEDGRVIAQLDLRHDGERLRSNGDEVFALVDATDPSIPSGRIVRLVYHPPAAASLQTKTKGINVPATSGPVIITRHKKKR